MASIYHYDDVVNPHPSGFKGIRCVVSSPAKIRQKYFSDKKYDGDAEAQLFDARAWLTKAELQAERERIKARLTRPSEQGRSLPPVGNIHLTVAKKRGSHPGNMRWSPRLNYQLRVNTKIISSRSLVISNEKQYNEAYRELVLLKLRKEKIRPFELWKNYYMALKPSYQEVIRYLNDRYPGKVESDSLLSTCTPPLGILLGKIVQGKFGT